MIRTTVSRAALIVFLGGTGFALLAGCSSGSTNSAVPTQARTTSSPSSSPAKAAASLAPSPAAAAGQCTEVSILAALPAGSTMVKYECAIVSPTMWAVARVNPGPTVFFLQSKSGAWKVSKASQICGVSSAKLPKEISAFCPNA